MGIGRAWARGRRGAADPETLREDLDFWGLTFSEEQAPPETEVWPEHVDALGAWLAICGQWRVVTAGLGGVIWLGLDYAAARAGLDLAGLTVSPATWHQIQAIEAGAREELNRRD